MKFQIPSMHHSEVNRRTHRHTGTQTDRQAESNMPFQLFQSWEHKKGHNFAIQKIRVNYFIMRNVYMKFQTPSIHRSKVSNFTEKWKNQSKFQNSVFLLKFDRKFSKVNQVIYFSAPTSVPNMKALASILFEISCTQDFQILFSK